jgi:hypothetical protein
LETATRAADGYAFVLDLQPGDWVSLHWNWVCDRLSQRSLTALRHYTARQFAITNHRVEHSGPAVALA